MFTRWRLAIDTEIYLTKKTIFSFQEQFTFKSKRCGNDGRLKLKFYINDVLEDEMIACCEYSLMNRNQRNHFFQIDNILGAKPCDK